MSDLEMKYFVLKPRGTDIYARASRRAMFHYADVIKETDLDFAEQIRKWASKEALAALESSDG